MNFGRNLKLICKLIQKKLTIDFFCIFVISNLTWFLQLNTFYSICFIIDGNCVNIAISPFADHYFSNELLEVKVDPESGDGSFKESPG